MTSMPNCREVSDRRVIQKATNDGYLTVNAAPEATDRALLK